MVTHPRYVRKIQSTYYFRMAIPTHLQARVGAAEFLKSLKTTQLAEASRIALNVAYVFETIFKDDVVVFKGDIRKKLHDSFHFILQNELPALVKQQPINSVLVKPHRTL
jgi:Domain of unknown function (DUF6538)